MSSSDILVFDTEPLIAYFFDEDGSDTVESHLQRVADGTTGAISVVNLSEVLYIAASEGDWQTAETCVQSIRRFGIEILESMETWQTASMIKHTHSIALGDSYAVAAADHYEGTLLVGADDDFDSITEVSIERFRTEPA
jgi:predicted nucleic acid-binding protein